MDYGDNNILQSASHNVLSPRKHDALTQLSHFRDNDCAFEKTTAIREDPRRSREDGSLLHEPAIQSLLFKPLELKSLGSDSIGEPETKDNPPGLDRLLPTALKNHSDSVKPTRAATCKQDDCPGEQMQKQHG